MIAGTVPLQIIVHAARRRREPGAGDPPEHARRARRARPRRRAGLGAGSTALGLAVMVSATMFWSLGSFLSKRALAPSDPFVATVYEMAFGGAFLLHRRARVRRVRRARARATFALDSVLAWVYLVVMGSLVGFTAYAWLLRVAPISLVVTHQYVNPLVAIALGMLFLGERPSPWSLAGARSSIGAVYVAIARRSSRRNG